MVAPVQLSRPVQEKETIQGFKWLNENGTIYDFESLNDLLTRLTVSVENRAETRTLFNSKNAHIFVATFKVFTESGRKMLNLENSLTGLWMEEIRQRLTGNPGCAGHRPLNKRCRCCTWKNRLSCGTDGTVF